MVPKFWFDEEGNLGERNDAYVTSLEHKMGINGSATCVLALGSKSTCRGWLIGEEGKGLPIMFHLMNEARVGVGAQGQAMAAAAYNYALAYAKDRIQGTELENIKDANAPRVPIVVHPDVRRMLMFMKVHVETMRSLVYKLAHRMNVSEDPSNDMDAEAELGRLELLVPVVKAHCTDMGFECCVQAVQVYGGHGYTGEYPVEQLLRDAKIMTIYEGTNGVQALDLLGRKLRQKGGALLMSWIADAQATCKLGAEAGFEKEAGQIGKTIGSLGASAMHLGGLGMQGKINGAMVHATTFQRMMGIIVLAVEAMEQATVAKRIISERGATNHLETKALNLTWYVNNVLPEAIALSKIIQSGDDTAMDPRLFV
jgi:hypothetical protein